MLSVLFPHLLAKSVGRVIAPPSRIKCSSPTSSKFQPPRVKTAPPPNSNLGKGARRRSSPRGHQAVPTPHSTYRIALVSGEADGDLFKLVEIKPDSVARRCAMYYIVGKISTLSGCVKWDIESPTGWPIPQNNEL